MKPKIAEKVPAEAWKLLGTIRQIIDALPETIERPAFILGIRVDRDVAIAHTIPNCHVVTRAIAAFFPVVVHDGVVCILNAEQKPHALHHSWLTLKDGDPNLIIDPWPLGVVSGPALFFQNYAYHFGPEGKLYEHSNEEFECEVQAMTDAVRKVLHDLNLMET